jgi:hypothetical protein
MREILSFEEEAEGNDLDNSSQASVPILNKSIPATSGHFRLLQGMPFGAYANSLMTFECAEHFTSFPVPEPAATFTITGHDKPTIW